MTNKPFHLMDIPKRNILNGEPFLKSIWSLRYMVMDIEKEFRKYTDFIIFQPSMSTDQPPQAKQTNFQ